MTDEQTGIIPEPGSERLVWHAYVGHQTRCGRPVTRAQTWLWARRQAGRTLAERIGFTEASCSTCLQVEEDAAGPITREGAAR